MKKYINLFKENLLKENLFKENLFKENLFKENGIGFNNAALQTTSESLASLSDCLFV